MVPRPVLFVLSVLSVPVLALSAFVGVAACTPPPRIDLDPPPTGEGEGEGEGEDGGDVDLAALQARFDEVRCALFACEHRAAQTTDICAAAAREPRAPYHSIAIAAAYVADNRAVLDQAAANACAAAIDAVAATTDACIGPDVDAWRAAMDALAEACGPALYVGAVDEGGACDDDSVCADGGVCPRDRQIDCEGSCVRPLGVGEACVERPGDCVPEAFCDGAVCVRRPLKPIGEFCVDASECQTFQCLDSTCRDKSPRDGECVVDDDCQEGFDLYCRPLPPSTGRLGICQRPVATGEACGFAVRCEGNQACAGHARRFGGGAVDGVCQASVGAVGDVCVPLPAGFDVHDSGCSAELRCDPSTSLCVVAPAVGEACIDGACGAFAYCDDSNVCRAWKNPGATASHPRECRFGLDGGFSVSSGTCVDPSTVTACGF
jgi:hypothetical protein